MIASGSRALYIGMTKDLHRRVWEHKNDLVEGFTRQYKCHRLVYYESFDDVNKAIDREKQLKRWNRAKKEKIAREADDLWSREDLLFVCSGTLPANSRSLHARVDRFAINSLGRDDRKVGNSELEINAQTH